MSTPAKKLLSPEAQQVLDQARALPREEQLHLAEQLQEEGQQVERAEGLHPDWDEELGRRFQKIADGTAVLHDWEDVKKELYEIADS